MLRHTFARCSNALILFRLRLSEPRFCATYAVAGGANSARAPVYNHARGFTFVEMVVVIIVLGILSVGTVQFINRASEGYLNGGRRAELASAGRSSMARMTAELSNALARSVRVANGCVEFVPIVAATQYKTLPRVTSASSLELSILDPEAAVTSARIAVNADSTAGIYGLTSVSPVATFSAPNASNVVTATLASAHAFPQGSARSRAYLVDNPVSFCIDGAHLWRFGGYGYSSTQKSTAQLAAASSYISLIGDELDAATSSFAVTTVTRDRAASIDIQLTLLRDGESMRLQSTVQVPNAP